MKLPNVNGKGILFLNPPYNLLREIYGGFVILEEKQVKTGHKLQMTDRETGSISRVKDVVAFDDGEISLITNAGMLTIKGSELHVTRLDLDKQEVDIAGQVDSLVYSQGTVLKSKGGDGMLKRLFK